MASPAPVSGPGLPPEAFLGLCLDRVGSDEATGAPLAVTGFVLAALPGADGGGAARWTVQYTDGVSAQLALPALAEGLAAHAARAQHAAAVAAHQLAAVSAPPPPPPAAAACQAPAVAAKRKRASGRHQPKYPNGRPSTLVAPRPPPADRRLYKGVYWRARRSGREDNRGPAPAQPPSHLLSRLSLAPHRIRAPPPPPRRRVERVAKYICQYSHNGHNYGLGSFDESQHEEAARVFDAKARAARGGPSERRASTARRAASAAAAASRPPRRGLRGAQMRELGRREVNFPDPARGEARASFRGRAPRVAARAG